MQRLGLTPARAHQPAVGGADHEYRHVRGANPLYHQALLLSDNQRMEIDHHPEESVRILQDCFVGDELWLRVVPNTRKLGGSGYP